jgi:hypothetical protein
VSRKVIAILGMLDGEERGDAPDSRSILYPVVSFAK